MEGGRPALPRGEARNLQPKGGVVGAADGRAGRACPSMSCLGMTVTLEPIGGASAQGPLMANGIGWEEGDKGMILGPSPCLWPPFCFAPLETSQGDISCLKAEPCPHSAGVR